jgi:hypothetical protein
MIWDVHPDPAYFPSRIRITDPGVKKHRVPDPDPQDRFLVSNLFHVKKS